ncbi:MAG: dihydropyrimidine dehydrogenase, partial [Paracoccaceae bacterium]
APQGARVDGGKIAATPARVWAGGDCAAGGEDLTVTAVAQGRDAAEAIHAQITAV